jgi:integrase
MKKTISKLLLLFFIFVTPQAFSQDSLTFQEKRLIDRKDKISRITTVKNAYIIEGGKQKDSLIFKNNLSTPQARSTIDSRFRIKRISSVNHAYVIEALNLEDSLIYKIVSLKKRKLEHPKISEGGVYRLLIKPHFREMKMILSNPMTAIVIIEDKKVSIKGFGENIYICSNLIGLNLTPPDEIR